MDRTSRYARCEAPTRSCTLSTTAANGHSQRNKETGEPDDATSILSGSAGGWEKRPKGPRSQPTQLQSSSSTFSCVSFPSIFAFQEGMWDTQISALLGSPTVSGRLLHSMEDRTSYASWGPLYVSLVLFLLNYIYYIYKITDHMFCPYETSCLRVKEHAYDRRAVLGLRD